MNHTQLYICPLPLELPSLLSPHPTALGCHRAPVWVPWVTQQIPTGCLGSVYVSMLLSPFVTLSPSPPPARQQVCSLGPSLYSCPANRFISTIFLDYIYIYIYMSIYLFSSFLISLCQIGTRFIQLIELTQMCSFSWLNNILLYIYTTACLSVHLLMDISVASMS